MTWWEYVQRHTQGHATQGQIARQAGVDQTAVSRWKRKGEVPAAQTVIEVARALERPPTEALLASGHITADEARAQVTEVRVTEPTDDELLSMLAERLRKAGDHRGNTAPTNPARVSPASPARSRGRSISPDPAGPAQQPGRGRRGSREDGQG